MVQIKPTQGNSGLEHRTRGQTTVTDCTVKVEEAKGGDWSGTQYKWGMMAVDKWHSDRKVWAKTDVGNEELDRE